MTTKSYAVASRAAAALLLCASASAVAQQVYPAKPIRIINPYAPGGSTEQ